MLDLFPVHHCYPHFQTKKLFQSSFLYTLLKVSQLKTIWFKAENWPRHFTLEAENPFTCTLHCIFTFFIFFLFSCSLVVIRPSVLPFCSFPFLFISFSHFLFLPKTICV